MKISMIGPVYPYRGGISHYTSSLARALGKEGHEVQMISFKRQYPAFLYPGQSDKDPSANPIRVDASYLLDPLYPWTWQQGIRAISSSRPDLLLIQWWTTFWGPAYAALVHQARERVPVVYLIHNVLPHEPRIWDKWLARLALGPASAFIVQAPHEQKRLLDLFPKARISYCEHPVYQRFSEQAVSREAARRQLGLPEDGLIFLFFGIIRPYKGVSVLLKALAHSAAPVHLVVGGEFWEDVEGYRRQIDDLGLAGRVTLIDRYIANEEAHLLFSAADALMAPYIRGTQSGAVELALGYGLPAIITDTIAAGVTETNAVSMQVVPAGDVPELSAALARLSQSLPERQPSQPAQDDWIRMVKTIEEIRDNIKTTG